MKAIVTVIGKDSVGIIAAVCSLLASYSINILDISQTVMQGYFTMMMAVDTAGSAATFQELADSLNALGQQSGLSIRIQREDIFDAMHRV